MSSRSYNRGQTKSDLSQVLRPIDILGVPQEIKGFGKSDFCEVLSIYHRLMPMWDAGK